VGLTRVVYLGGEADKGGISKGWGNTGLYIRGALIVKFMTPIYKTMAISLTPKQTHGQFISARMAILGLQGGLANTYILHPYVKHTLPSGGTLMQVTHHTHLVDTAPQ
jgi:hypothetical protein